VRLPRCYYGGSWNLSSQDPYVPKYQIARRQVDFPMSLSGNWLIWSTFKTNMQMTAIPIRLPSTLMVDPKTDASHLRKTPQTGKMVPYRTQESDVQRLRWWFSN
jgi:hypothetical protein